jgi:hypothetical protein
MSAAVAERNAPNIDIERIDRDRTLEESRNVVDIEKQCRIELHPEAPQANIELPWHAGKGHRPTVLLLKRGGTPVVQSLGKAQVWFGPFGLALEFSQTTDERRREKLREEYHREKMRILNRYDYPRGTGRGYNPSMEPIGPHRFPDVVVTILEADGSEVGPYRLHELYKIGHWDPLKDQFEKHESAAEIEARSRAEIESNAARFAEVVEAQRREIARLAGMVEGALGASKPDPKKKPAEAVAV